MGEFRCWIEKKDNPGMTDAEVRAFQKKHLDPLNSEHDPVDKDRLEAVENHEDWWRESCARR